MLNERASILDVGFLVLLLVGLASVSTDFAVMVLPIGYVAGMVLRPKPGLSTLSEVLTKYNQSIVVTVAVVYVATSSFYVAAEVMLIIKAVELIARKTQMGWTGLLFGNVHASIVLNFMIGLSTCYKNMPVSYFIAGMTFGYLCSVIDSVAREGLGFKGE